MSLDSLALFLQTIGDYATAQALFERSLKIREQALGPMHPKVATSLNDLGELLRATGEHAEARAMHERALKIREQALGPTHPEVATSLSSLGSVLAATGDYAGAEPLFQRALRIRMRSLGPNHPLVASSLYKLGSLHWLAEDLPGAKFFYERALATFEVTSGPGHPDMAWTLGSLAVVEWYWGRSEEALPKLSRAVAIVRTHMTHGLVGLSSRQKLDFLATLAPLMGILLSLPSGVVPEADAYQAVLDWKNLLFRTLVEERTLIEASSSAHVRSLAQEYTAIRRQLAAASISSSSDLRQHHGQLASLTKRLELLEGELSTASAAFRQAQAEATAGGSDVCAAVPLDAALVDVLWYGRNVPPISSATPHYVAFVLRGGECEKPIRVDLGPAAPLDEEVGRFRDALSREAPDPAARELRATYRRSLAARLHARLFPPALQRAIVGKPRLLIAPDGVLSLLPFALLPGEDGHEFLVETRTVSYIPSGRDLLRRRVAPSAPTGLLAVGAPAFEQAPIQTAHPSTLRAGCGVPEDPFVPLPGTARELRAIAAIYQKAHATRPLILLQGTQATKAALLERASSAEVLHLATHAYFAGEECTPAGLVVVPQRTMGEAPAFLGYNPLVLAGIALAGANEREKADGILTALEVTALDLRGTSLVVLSACDTGLGTVARGQELLGLRWAFAYAGARHLVTSLWSVPDVGTATLMTHFYSALWEKGLSVPAALRTAQLEMLKAARAKGDSVPYAWGAFVASGRPD